MTNGREMTIGATVAPSKRGKACLATTHCSGSRLQSQLSKKTKLVGTRVLLVFSNLNFFCTQTF